MLLPSAHTLPLDEALAHYREHGYARLGRVANDSILQSLRERCDALMLGHIRYEGMFFQHDSQSGRYEDLRIREGFVGPSLHYRKLEKLELDPVYRAWINNPLFERIGRAWIGPDIVLYRAVIFAKAAQGGTFLPWHQDGGTFWGLSEDPTLQIWTALDDAPVEAGCVEVVPGSHKAGLSRPLGGVVPDNVAAAADAESRALPLPARAGEVLLIHNHLWHRSGVNHTSIPRRALTICLMGAHVRCRRKKRAPRTFMPLFTDDARARSP